MPLKGIKVIEACSNISGPVAGTIFGDLGADVIKIEKPDFGDDVRGWAPPDWNGMSARFRAINRNKRSVTLDLRNSKDIGKLKKLVLQADVFIHNMRPGAVEAIGLSGAEALTLNPRLLYCSIGAFGNKGPWRTRSAYDALAQAVSSQMAGNGAPDGEPMLVADAPVDRSAGMWATIAVLAGLFRRETTGKGGIVETSLLEAALFSRDNVFAQYLASGRAAPRPGNGSRTVVPYGVFRTADSPILIGCAGDSLFATLAALLGHQEWSEDPRFAKNSARILHRVVLESLLEEVLTSRPRDEWVELLGANRIPCAPILATDEAFAHPQVQALGIFQSPPGVEMPLVSAPWTLDGIRPPIFRGAPQLGEDNEILEREGWGDLR